MVFLGMHVVVRVHVRWVGGGVLFCIERIWYCECLGSVRSEVWSDEDRQFVRVRYVQNSSASGPEGSGPYCQLVRGDVEDRLELRVL